MRRSVLRIAGYRCTMLAVYHRTAEQVRLTVDDTFLGRTSLPRSWSSREIDVKDDPIPDDTVILSEEVGQRTRLIGLEGFGPPRHVYRTAGRFDRWVKDKDRSHPAFSRAMDQI